MTSLESGGGGALWYEGATREQVTSAYIPSATNDVEQHRITIPAGTNKIVQLKAWSTGSSEVPFTARVDASEYLGAAWRDSAGTLIVDGTGISLSSAGGTPSGMMIQDMIVDGDDLVVRVQNTQKEQGKIITALSYVILDAGSAIPVP